MLRKLSIKELMPFLIQSESVVVLIPQRPKQIIKLKLEISNFQFLSQLLHFIFHLLLQDEKKKKKSSIWHKREMQQSGCIDILCLELEADLMTAQGNIV